jgi:hypothetical protein
MFPSFEEACLLARPIDRVSNGSAPSQVIDMTQRVTRRFIELFARYERSMFSESRESERALIPRLGIQAGREAAR